MNDLDRRIAELKGFTYKGPKHTITGPDGKAYLTSWLCWTESDAKALELVDEWVAMEKGNFAWVTTLNGSATATFSRGYSIRTGGILVASFTERTRPEAICRAWVAAMEWLKMRAADKAWRKQEEAKDEALAREIDGIERDAWMRDRK